MSSETIESWLNSQRIVNIPRVLNALRNLGATELNDLVDLSEADVSTFQHPFLKSVEYKRFVRGITLLKDLMDSDSSKNDALKVNVIDHDVNDVSDTTSDADRNPSPTQDEEHQMYLHPPLPSKCPTKMCNGVLVLYLGEKRSQYLMKLHGTPDARWIAVCESCSKKWHCCHFLCGKLQKITPLGSSEIIRHEQGRINRWQKKIQLPCPKNPQFDVLKARYEQKMSVIKTDAMLHDLSVAEMEKADSTMNGTIPNNIFQHDGFLGANYSFDEDLLRSTLVPNYNDELEIEILQYNLSTEITQSHESPTISNNALIPDGKTLDACPMSAENAKCLSLPAAEEKDDVMNLLCIWVNEHCLIHKGLRAIQKVIRDRYGMPKPKKLKQISDSSGVYGWNI
jgi:hypothetical protein